MPLPDGQPFSPVRDLLSAPAEQVHPPSHVRSETEASSSAEAPQRNVRVPKVLQPDTRQELANADLAQWNSNYLANMAEATKIKQQHKAGTLAKRNAAFWVLGQGLAGVGSSSGNDRVPNPLQVYSGPALLAALAWREEWPRGIKRTRSPSDNSSGEKESRRVKIGHDEELQMGRGGVGGSGTEGVIFGDDDGMMFPEDIASVIPFRVVTC